MRTVIYRLGATAIVLAVAAGCVTVGPTDMGPCSHTWVTPGIRNRRNLMMQTWWADLKDLKVDMSRNEISMLLESRGYILARYSRALSDPYWDSYECDRYPCMLLYVEMSLDEHSNSTVLSWNLEDFTTGYKISNTDTKGSTAKAK